MSAAAGNGDCPARGRNKRWPGQSSAAYNAPPQGRRGAPPAPPVQVGAWEEAMRKLSFALVVLAGATLAGPSAAQDQGEPFYQGRPLSAWLKAVKDKDRATRQQAA